MYMTKCNTILFRNVEFILILTRFFYCLINLNLLFTYVSITKIFLYLTVSCQNVKDLLKSLQNAIQMLKDLRHPFC